MENNNFKIETINKQPSGGAKEVEDIVNYDSETDDTTCDIVILKRMIVWSLNSVTLTSTEHKIALQLTRSGLSMMRMMVCQEDMPSLRITMHNRLYVENLKKTI